MTAALRCAAPTLCSMTNQALQRVPDLSESQYREFVSQGICPFCRRGPYSSLANHTALSHGVKAEALRDLCAYPLDVPLCDSTLSEKRQALAVQNNCISMVVRRPKGGKNRVSVALGNHLKKINEDSTTRNKSIETRAANKTLRTTCASGKHAWTEDNLIFQKPNGAPTCKPCRRAREQARRKARTNGR